jgi:hypothetical protein
MTVGYDQYVPALSWRMAEYQALYRLPEAAKSRVVPLVTVPRIEFDFETRRPKHTVQEHVEPFPKRFEAKWGARRAWVDVDPSLWLSSMDDGTSVHRYSLYRLATVGCNAIPVAHLSSPPSVLSTLRPLAGTTGIGVRLYVEELISPTASAQLTNVMTALGVTAASIDLLVDLRAPTYEPVAIFVHALRHALTRLSGYASFRSIVVVGTAFPESLAEVPPPGGVVPRLDWQFYQSLTTASSGDPRLPVFGDYATVAPSFAADFDMRFVKPAGKLVYTTPTEWLVRKGGAFRDNPGQMRDHARYVVSSPHFRGEAFSPGDRFINDCAAGREGTSSLTKWKEVAISHHVLQVLDDLASRPSLAALRVPRTAVV